MTLIGRDTTAHRIRVPDSDEVVELSWGVATDVGRRRLVNEDSAVAVAPVFIVADGMGGHSAGDLASAAVVTRMAAAGETHRGSWGDPEALFDALEVAANDIDHLAEDSPRGAGTTVTGAVLALDDDGPVFEVFNIGDSRVYRFWHNELRQVTVDHSVVQELVDAGLLDAEGAEQHPESNVITRAVGFREVPRPDRWTLALHTGMRLLVCSDGLTKEIGAERIRLHLAAGLAPASTAAALVDAALAAGGRDNVTVIVVDVVSAPSRDD